MSSESEDEVKRGEEEDTVGDLITNLGAGKDAFSGTGAASAAKVHIRIQMRNGRKSITSVAGLDDDLDLKRILKACKKTFSCNGAVVRAKKGDDAGDVIQLQGDQRQAVKAFLIENSICDGSRLVVHGF